MDKSHEFAFVDMTANHRIDLPAVLDWLAQYLG
jgi:hypothetical protein